MSTLGWRPRFPPRCRTARTAASNRTRRAWRSHETPKCPRIRAPAAHLASPARRWGIGWGAGVAPVAEGESGRDRSGPQPIRAGLPNSGTRPACWSQVRLARLSHESGPAVRGNGRAGHRIRKGQCWPRLPPAGGITPGRSPRPRSRSLVVSLSAVPSDSPAVSTRPFVWSKGFASDRPTVSSPGRAVS